MKNQIAVFIVLALYVSVRLVPYHTMLIFSLLSVRIVSHLIECYIVGPLVARFCFRAPQPQVETPTEIPTPALPA
jgi:hypothetical protein